MRGVSPPISSRNIIINDEEGRRRSGEGSGSLALTSLSSPPVTTTPTTPQVLFDSPPRGLLAMHRMPAYRSRVLTICHNVLHQHHHQNMGNDDNDEDLKIEVEHREDLAPMLSPERAEMHLPVAWTPSSSSSNVSSSSPPPFPSLVALRKFPFSWTSTKSTTPITTTTDSSTTYHRSLSLPTHSCTLSVNIHGQGLDTCTAAVLHFPDGEIISGRFLSGGGGGGGEPSKENATTVDELKARLLHDALHEAEGGAAVEKKSSLARRIFNKVMSTKKEQEQASHYFYQGEVETGDVVFEFEVPALKLLELESSTTTSTSDSSRGVPKNDSPPTITLPLTLFSDFYKVQTVVQCISMTAWMIPLESFETLGKGVFSALEQAAVDDCINSAAASYKQQQQQQQNRNKQKTDNKISISNSSGEEASASISSVKNERQQGATVAAASVLPAPSSSLKGRLNEQGNRVLHYLQGLQDKWLLPPSHFRSVLLRGVLIRDASVAIDSAAPKDPVQRLKIATELLKWKSSTFDKRKDKNDDDDEIEFWNDLEVDDEEVSPESEIGLRGRLKRQLKRALQGASLWQKQRWRLLAEAPPPDVIVLLASRSTILNTDSNTSASEFNLPVVEAVHSLAAAAAACRASVLLTVAAPEAQDVMFRRRLSFSSGLHGRPGAVVPLEVVDSAVDCLLLQSSIVAHASAAAATAAQQARRSERSLFHARL